MIRLLYIDKKYSKSSFSTDVKIGHVLQIGTINQHDRIIIPCNNKESILGIYKGNGIVRTFGKCKVMYEKK